MAWTLDNLRVFAAGLAVGGKYNEISDAYIDFPPGPVPPETPVPPLGALVWIQYFSVTSVFQIDVSFGSSSFLASKDYVFFLRSDLVVSATTYLGRSLRVFFIVNGIIYLMLFGELINTIFSRNYNFTSANSSRILRVHPDKSISIAGVHCPPGHFGVRIVSTSNNFITLGGWADSSIRLHNLG